MTPCLGAGVGVVCGVPTVKLPTLVLVGAEDAGDCVGTDALIVVPIAGPDGFVAPSTLPPDEALATERADGTAGADGRDGAAGLPAGGGDKPVAFANSVQIPLGRYP